MKNLILLMLLSLIWVQASSQTIDNVQEIASIAPVTGSSPDIPSFYEWEEVSNTTQGANIHLAQTEIRDIYLQQNNHNLAFNLLGTSSFINKLEVNYDDTGWVTIHDNGNTQSVGWENTPNFFNSIGFHNLKVRYFNQSPTSPFFREYSVVVIPECEKFYRDNTKSTDPAVFTTGNTLTLWNEASTPNAKPMLIVEGYDAINSYYPERYRAAGIEWFPRVYELGYEIYLLNFNLANQDLKNNAAVVHSAIEYISSITNGQDVAVAGVSMGGVIARYALAKDEQDGTGLPVSLFASFDSPQQGAVIDANFQDNIFDLQPDDFPSLNNDAAKQQLIYNPYDFTQSMHQSFYDELNALNGDGYPTQIPTIGIAFSNETPNLGIGNIWISIALNAGNNFIDYGIQNEWAQAGSYLPVNSTNIDAENLPWLSHLEIEFDRKEQNGSPTFIPYESALDIVNGESKFCFPIEIEASESAFPHDVIPSSVINPFIGILRGTSLSTIQNNEVYNITDNITEYLLVDLDIEGDLFINKNDFSGSSFNPEAPAPKANHDVSTSGCYPITITAETNAEANLGDGTDFLGNLYLREGSQMILNPRSTLNIREGSKLVVEEGSKLVVEEGAFINLVGNESTIHIKNGGELVINGEFDFEGLGFFQFDSGNILTLNAPFKLTGQNRDHRFIQLNTAQLLIDKQSIELNNGQVVYNGGEITVKDRGIALMDNVEFRGSGNGIGIYSEGSRQIQVDNCIFRQLEKGLHIESYPSVGGVLLSNILPIVLRTEFTGNDRAIQLVATPGILLDDCKISGGEVGIYANFTTAVNIKDTDIWGYRGSELSQNSIKGSIVLNDVGTLSMEGGRIYENKKGIYSPENKYINRIVLRDNAAIEGNDIGIEMYGHVEGFAGVDQAGNGFTGLGSGGLWVDCSAIRQNRKYGVFGHDILLKIDALDPSTGSNDFEHDFPESKIFGIVYEEYNIGNTILARNNYWDEVNCPNSPNNYYLRYTSDAPDIILDVGTSCTKLFSCEAPDPDDPKFPEEEVCDDRLEEKSNGGIHETLEMGFIQLWYGDYAGAATTLAPIAQIPDRDIDRLDGICRQDVYLARLIAPQNLDQSKLKLLEQQSVESSQKLVAIYPNPTSSNFSIDLTQGDYNVEIFNALGQSVLQQQIFETKNIQTDSWNSGVYFIRILDNTTQQFFEERLIIE